MDLDPLQTAVMTTVCQYGLMVGTSCWGSWTPRQKTSPLSSQLVWWQQPSSEWSFHHLSILTRCVHKGHMDTKHLPAAAPAFTKLWALVCFCWRGVHNFRETTAAFTSKQLSNRHPPMHSYSLGLNRRPPNEKQILGVDAKPVFQ